MGKAGFGVLHATHLIGHAARLLFYYVCHGLMYVCHF